MGARVTGLDLKVQKPSDEVVKVLQDEMAERGFIVFADQGVMTGDEQVAASKLWGAKQMHSTHGVHPKSPSKHIFRLSNDPTHGGTGVGPQWHNDGSFCVDVFSHVGYHIIRVPENGGGTYFSHQGAAYDALPKEKQEEYSQYVSINSSSGVLHPMVHKHWISGRKSVWLHLQMTGAVLKIDPTTNSARLLTKAELFTLCNEYHDLLDGGLPENGGNYSIAYAYQPGDCIFIDNLAISHRASAEAHMSAAKQGLRILHRSTIKSPNNFSPPQEWLPPQLDIYGPNPFNKDGIWLGEDSRYFGEDYNGFLWDNGSRKYK